MRRKDNPEGPISAFATRKQLERDGEVQELEPGVLQVVTLAGRRLRWCRVFGRDLYRLASETEEAA
jgi:hypothetical protein